MLTVTWLDTPNDESTRISLEIPRAVDARGGAAVEEFIGSYKSLRAAGADHETALVESAPDA